MKDMKSLFCQKLKEEGWLQPLVKQKVREELNQDRGQKVQVKLVLDQENLENQLHLKLQKINQENKHLTSLVAQLRPKHQKKVKLLQKAVKWLLIQNQKSIYTNLFTVFNGQKKINKKLKILQTQWMLLK